MMIKYATWTLFILLTSSTVFGQTLIRGSASFDPCLQKNKPTEMYCGQVEVFEDNILNRGKKIKLYVEVLPAKTAGHRADPMFIVMGGPGQASTDLVGFFAEIFKKINQKSDLVFIDQRGTGKSNPLQLIASYNSLQDYFRDEFVSASIVSNSYNTLSKNNNLAFFGTLNAVIDIETVRNEMGYNQINLYGTSYGTRVSLAYINKYPTKVRTATLKGLVPTDLVIPLTFAKDAQRSLDLLLNDCKQNAACNAAFPGLDRVTKHFFADPLPVTATILNPETNKVDTVQIGKEIVALSLRVLLMSPSTAKTIPFLITEAANGNTGPLANVVLSIKKSYLKGVYDGMTLCVICREDYPNLQNASSPNTKETFLQDYWIHRIKTACAIWNKAGIKASPIKLTKQRTPVLIISGNRDAATPPKNGEAGLKYFPNGKHVIVGQGSHSFDGMRNCVENIICNFVLRGSASRINSKCVTTIRFPDYKLK